MKTAVALCLLLASLALSLGMAAIYILAGIGWALLLASVITGVASAVLYRGFTAQTRG